MRVIKLFDNESNALLGEINEAQLQFLIDHLEETALTDRDYYLQPATLGMLAEAGADDELLEILGEALGDLGEVEIRWE